ncbi:BQ5605_C044g12169 [Microbotryum silenes-dioicae]|uniref:BQ5605_C044g12169 protein n=1 Tax=Microbotryum silenes-dioicae TaxID=796604 RepID=A0A2X0PPU6_9BASI|nr:BQ5605_C044g12169 [Microbotryum silenes-dioicae]
MSSSSSRSFRLKLLLASETFVPTSQHGQSRLSKLWVTEADDLAPPGPFHTVDTAFLILELGVGTAVGSLALVADSFHILLVAMQAMKLAESSSASAKYSYGWQRAEVLGALINSVFLLALCFSIGMEAIARFLNRAGPFELRWPASPKAALTRRNNAAAAVTNPQLIVAVGTAGLVSNIVGLFLFHAYLMFTLRLRRRTDHGGHSHGGGGGGHSHGGGHNHATLTRDVESDRPPPQDHQSGRPSDRTPLLAPAPSASRSHLASTSPSTLPENEEDLDEGEDIRAEDELFVHPGELRGNIVKAAHEAGYGATASTSNGVATKSTAHVRRDSQSEGHGHDHGHGQSHDADVATSGQDGSMNMRGVFLHVLGDALGNVGVIGAGLFIWLTDYEWRMYSDPLISLVITCIIFSSALPLGKGQAYSRDVSLELRLKSAAPFDTAKSASFILLQGVPSSIPLDRLRTAIANVPGVANVHELHVWSLSESKSVASVHVMTASDDMIEVSSKIRRVMHRFGIHSSTIQPEIIDAKPKLINVDPELDSCAVLCATDSCRESACCPPSDAA